LVENYREKDFWNKTANLFGYKNDYTPVLHPSAKGLLNWYTDLLQRNAMRSTLKNLEGDLALDLGCGIGRWSEKVFDRGLGVIGVDLSREMIKKARARLGRKKRGINFIVASADKLPFVNQIFDTIISVTVLQHITEDWRFKSATSEIARTVKHSGNVVLLEYTCTKKTYGSDFPTVAHNYRERLTRLGFSLVEMQGVDLSAFLKPTSALTKRYGKYNKLLQKQTDSAKYSTMSAVYYYFVSIAALFSLPFDLTLRKALINICDHTLLIFKNQ
jgi:ubiquinone/menaquinone biosynthesis C-methylase UbiE